MTNEAMDFFFNLWNILINYSKSKHYVSDTVWTVVMMKICMSSNNTTISNSSSNGEQGHKEQVRWSKTDTVRKISKGNGESNFGAMQIINLNIARLSNIFLKKCCSGVKNEEKALGRLKITAFQSRWPLNWACSPAATMHFQNGAVLNSPYNCNFHYSLGCVPTGWGWWWRPHLQPVRVGAHE